MITRVNFRNIILKSSLAVIIYIIITLLSDWDPIKESFDDASFDKIITENTNTYESYNNNIITTDLPKLNVFVIDDDYLDYYKLNNYGYFFPRKEMVTIIQSLNYLIDEIKVPPKAVFLDYDFHFTEKPYGRDLSQYDLELINQIIKLGKKSIVLIPKAKEFHYIESYLLANNLNIPNIIFVSPNFLVSDDLKSRRFQTFYESNGKIYPHASFMMYLINTNKCSNINELHKVIQKENSIVVCGQEIKNISITENRIIPKFFMKNIDNKYNYGFTLWDKDSSYQKIRPISTLVEESIVPKSLEDSIVMIAGDFSSNPDKIAIAYNSGPDALKLPGIMMHVNTLNTFHYFNGTLKNLNLVYGSIIVFLIFIFFSYLEEYNKVEKRKFKKFVFILSLKSFLVSIILMLISLMIILNFKLWFNWLAPLITYPIIEILEEYGKKSIIQLIRIKNIIKERILCR